MISIFKNSPSQGLATIKTPEAGCWINCTNPTPNEIDQLMALGIPQDYLTYPLDVDERARTERENGEILIVLRVPYYAGEQADIPYNTLPLGIIITTEYFLTISKQPAEILDVFLTGKVRNHSTAKPNRFLLYILLKTAERYLSIVREINKTVDQIEDKLQMSTRNRELLELLKYQKSLTIFTTSLKTNELMMERLQRSQLFTRYPEDEELLEDVLTENQQALEMTNIATNILSAMMDTFASLISNNLNGVMKLLASITIVVSLPTMIFSLYGMNIPLPFEDSAFAFAFVFSAAMIISLLAVFIFVKRDLF
jgi:magnesium transporter